MTEAASVSVERVVAIRFGRWWQLSLGVVCMSMIANLQYGWTLFVNPIHDRHGWSLPAIQVAFTVFVFVETWLVPIEGYLVDRFGPRFVGVAAGILVAASWVINSVADTLPLLYLGAVVGGIGAGAVYGACVGNALKWFPDRRGLAAGHHGDGFRRGIGVDRVPDCEHDQVAGLRGDVPQVRHRARRGRVPRQLVSPRARRAFRRLTLDANSRIVGRRKRDYQPIGDAPHAGVLGDVRHVRADRHGRT